MPLESFSFLSKGMTADKEKPPEESALGRLSQFRALCKGAEFHQCQKVQMNLFNQLEIAAWKRPSDWSRTKAASSCRARS